MSATGSQVSSDTQFVLFMYRLFMQLAKKERPHHLLLVPAKYGDLMANLYNDAC
jgi:hypothetical protein